jgi:hypothetical protein
MTQQTVEARALKWVSTGSTGISSKAILGVMTGNPPDDGYCYPHDGGDFQRCVVLLALIPEWKARLGEMKAVGPEWAALVDHWDELYALYIKHGIGREIYDRMKAILRPIEDKRPGLIRIGDSAALYAPSVAKRRTGRS